jgi:hypothetical protein
MPYDKSKVGEPDPRAVADQDDEVSYLLTIWRTSLVSAVKKLGA